jgi:hypothetical protein
MQILQADYYKERGEAGYFFARFVCPALLEDFNIWNALKVFLIVRQNNYRSLH